MQKFFSTWLIIGSVLTVIFVFSLVFVTRTPSLPTPTSPEISKDFQSEASLQLVAPLNGTIEVGQTQTVRWVSSNYGSSVVGINLIRKISENPIQYALVRVIADRTPNDGNATWVPAVTDGGLDLSIEIVCVTSTQACRAGNAPKESRLAVVNTGRFANTANAYKAIEQYFNR